MKHNPMKPKVYAPVRKCEDVGYEWIDYSALFCCREMVELKVKETDEKIPQWAKNNPVVSIIEVVISAL